MTKPLVHSFSSLKQFDNCPKRYFHQRIEKSVRDEGGEAAVYGEQVHKALEERVKDNKPLPPALAKHEEVCAKLVSIPDAEVHAEIEMVLTKDFTPTGWWSEDAWIRSKLDVLVIRGKSALVGDYKGLALDTKIPTPRGWTTMGEIRVGDELFDSKGKVRRVVGKSEVKHLPCYRITFSDGTQVICDNEHLWATDQGVILTSELLSERYTNGRLKRPKPRIYNTQPLDLPDADLPIHPYVLGMWLANGKHTNGEVTSADRFVWDEIRRCGYKVNESKQSEGKCPTYTVQGIRGALYTLGVAGNKHIPTRYLRASYVQRLALLQGLMDGDGSANEVRGQAVYSSTSKQLSEDVTELLASLGQRPYRWAGKAKGFGLTVDTYPIAFRPLDINPFRLPRKADRIDPQWADTSVSRYRTAKKVEEIESVPTQCIAVDSEDHTFLCTERMIPTHNTGKRRPDSFQLDLFALQTFCHYPDVDVVNASFWWLKDDAVDSFKYSRKEMPRLKQNMIYKTQRVEDALTHNNWPARPSGLCNYCPCKDFCEYAVRRR